MEIVFGFVDFCLLNVVYNYQRDHMKSERLREVSLLDTLSSEINTYNCYYNLGVIVFGCVRKSLF